MNVLVIFGSTSDSPVYTAIAKGLASNGVNVTVRALSAHRTPAEVDALPFDSYDAIVAGAGLAAHLPGVVAARSTSAVIGVPCLGAYEGLDSYLSIAQMPPGVPVLSVGVNASQAVIDSILAMGPTSINLVGDAPAKAKAIELLRSKQVPFTESAHRSDAINIIFTSHPPAPLGGLNIYVPTSGTTAQDAIGWMRASTHGLWVGLNRGENAAIAALQLARTHRDILKRHKEQLRAKALKDDEVHRWNS